MTSSDAPVFIHSLFRSGSTYIFNVFRRSDSGYYCYQEPLNETLLNAANEPDKLLDIHEETALNLRHPKLDKPYYYEYYPIVHEIGATFHKGFSCDQYFSVDADDYTKLAKYFTVLKNGAQGRPVFQCCRTAGRVAGLKSSYGGTHIFLWRNPWDQWWSYKKTAYFNITNMLIVNAAGENPFFKKLKNILNIASFHSASILDEYAFFSNHRLNAASSYKLFYALWCHAMLEAKPRCDLSINIDKLSNSDIYREKIVQELERLEIRGIDFSDAEIPLGIYGEGDGEFFLKTEDYIHELLLSFGYNDTQIEALKALSQIRQTALIDVCEPTNFAVRDAMRVREYQLQAEDDICHQQKVNEAALQQAEQEQQELNAQLQGLQVEVVQHQESLRQKESEKQALLLTLIEKETKQQESNAQIVDHKQQNNQLQTELTHIVEQKQALESSLQQAEQGQQKLNAQLQGLQVEVGQHQESLRQKENREQELLLALIEKETKQQESNAQLVERSQQNNELQTELTHIVEQKQALESSLQQAEQGQQKLNAQLQGLQVEVGQHQESLRQKENREQELLLALIEKETKQQESNAQLVERSQQNNELQTELTHIVEQKQALESSLQQAEQGQQELNAQLQGLQVEVGQHQESLRQKYEEIQSLASELETAKQQVNELHQSNHQWWTMADQHSKSLIEAEAKIDGLNQSSHHWWLESKRLSKELNTVYHSKSWIMTWPLRKLSQFVQWFFYLPVRFILWIIRLPKWLARWGLVKAMAFAVQHPGLRKHISFRLKKLEKVDGKLRQLALARGLLPPPPMPSQKDQLISEVDFLDIQKVQPPALEIKRERESYTVDPIIDQKIRVTLFYVEHTAMFDRVTGVQRVCHKLSSSLANNINETVILVKLDMASLEICPLNSEELKRFVSFSGFKINSDDARYYETGLFKTIISSLKNHPRKHWLVIPEVTYHSVHSPPPTSRLIKQARNYGLKVGVIEYDMIPLITEDASSNAHKHMNYISDISLADVIWPISHYASKGLVDYFLNDEKLSVHQMPIVLAKPLPEEKDGARVMPNMDEGDRNILCLGTIDERKNQISLIKAFNQYCESNPNTEWKLQLVGLIRDDYKPIIEKECSKNTNIKLYYSANDEDIECFFQNSAFTVFPSLEEGYGLPIVESLWHMRPCICANFGSMNELAMKGGCLSIDVRQVSELTTAISEMIHNENLYKEKINEILERSVNTWHEYAESILNDMDLYQYGNRCKGLIYYWVDATLAASGNTGIQRVNRQIAKKLMQQGHRLVPLKWNDSLNSIGLASTEDLKYLEQWNGPDRNGWYQQLELENESGDATYFMVDLPLNRSLDVQQHVIDTFKLKGIKCAAIFYDAIPYKLADIYPVDFTNAHKKYMIMLEQMDSVFSISKASNSDLLSFFNQTSVRGLCLEQRLKTVVLPAEFPGWKRSDPSVRNRGDECTILSVGTVEPRKNHIGLLQAFLAAEKNSQRKLKLILVGGGDTFDLELSDKIKTLVKQSENILWINNADDNDLKQYYHKADFTIFPSTEEGFGLPIVESLWFGCPCICANFGQMMELAASGGCAPVDVRDIEKFSEKILLLANNKDFYQQLKRQISRRYFKTWDNYASEISALLQDLHRIRKPEYKTRNRSANFSLPQRPLLSVCITTYKRARWLELNIENFIKIAKHLGCQVELVVCDNASPEIGADFFSKYQGHKQIFLYRNTGNIGMLGNLSQTVSLARGEYVWLIGDDDIIHKGSLEKIVDIIQSKKPDLINMNYAHTNDLEPPKKEMLKQYLNKATVICSGSISHEGTVKEVSSYNENFYTAIYSFVVKRNFAWRIYSQDTSGQPFSSLQTCIPTTKYILSNMVEAQAYWESEPLITVNLNVSWGQYAPLWILERIPEAYDLAELNGISMKNVDKWRKHTLQSSLTFLDIIYSSETPELYSQFNIIRFIRRNRHLSEFGDIFPQLEAVYANAFEKKSPLAIIQPEQLRALYYG